VSVPHEVTARQATARARVALVLIMMKPLSDVMLDIK